MTQANVRDLKFMGHSFGLLKNGKFGFFIGERKAAKAPPAPLEGWIIFFVHLLGARSPLRAEPSTKLVECFGLPIHTINTQVEVEVQTLRAKIEAARNGRGVLVPQQRRLLVDGKDIAVGSITFGKVDGGRWTLSSDSGGPFKAGPEVLLNIASIVLRDEWVRMHLPAYHVPWAPSVRPEYWEGDQPQRQLLGLETFPDEIWEQPSSNAPSGDDSGEKLKTSTPTSVAQPSVPAATEPRQDRAAKLLRALLDVDKFSQGNQEGPMAVLMAPLVSMVHAAAKALTEAGVQPAPEGVSAAALDQQAELLFEKHAEILRTRLQDEIAKAEKAKTIANAHIESLKTLAAQTEAQVQEVDQQREALTEEREEWEQLVRDQTDELSQREAALKASQEKLAQDQANLQQAQAASARDLLKNLKKGNG